MIATISGAALFAWLWPLVILAGVAAIIWWALEKLTLPRPFQIVAVILAAIVGIYVLLTIGPPPH